MGVCLMFMILLGCRLSEATQSHSTCECNGELQVFCGRDKEVHVPCPYVEASVMTFELYKNNIATGDNIKCERDNNTLNCTSQHNMIMDQTHQSIRFLLTEPSLGIYKCEGRVNFPPPVKTQLSEVQIQVGEPQCKNIETAPNPQHKILWIWIAVVSVLVVYSVAVTIISLVCWTKLKKDESHSDYMNTKPRAPRGPRKKGVQNPIPRF